MKENGMGMNQPLFEGELVCLAAINHEQDAQVESRWTQDADYLRSLGIDLVRLLSPAQVKKKYEKIEKEMDETGDQYYFTIRPSTKGAAESQDELLGFVWLSRIEWNHGTASLSLGIGDRADRDKGYGSEALRLMLRYAFRELNLFRLSASVPAYNQAALRLFDKAGFRQEVVQRQAFLRAGKRWDGIYLGLLREEWEQSAW